MFRIIIDNATLFIPPIVLKTGIEGPRRWLARYKGLEISGGPMHEPKILRKNRQAWQRPGALSFQSLFQCYCGMPTSFSRAQRSAEKTKVGKASSQEFPKRQG